MSFTKYLRIRGRNGQVALEYLILFSIVAILTIVSLNVGFLNGVKNTLQGQDGFFERCVRWYILGG